MLKKSITRTEKIPDASGIVKKTDYNAKITEIEDKTPSITGLATTASLTTVENKIPKVSNLVKQTDYDAKISNIESKYWLYFNIFPLEIDLATLRITSLDSFLNSIF